MTTKINVADKPSLHRHLLVHWELAIANGDFEKAIVLDSFHYNKLVKRDEDVVYWDKWQSDTLACRNKLSALFDKINPQRPSFTNPEEKFLIVFHNFSGLAHETQLARNLSYLRTHVQPLNFEVVYLFGEEAGLREQACRIYDLTSELIHFLSADSYETAGHKLDILARSQGYHSILYPSIFWMAYWMSLFVSHPNQKFLQMKYYPLHAGRIKSWAGGQRNDNEFYEILGYSFRQLATLDLRLSRTVFQSAPQNVDANMVAIGSISRPEKITNLEYNYFVKSILDKHPDYRYLYTGRVESLSVLPKFILDHPQAIGLGWVAPLEAINKFDVYLEPFPWGGGDMTFLALESGRAYLTLQTPENLRFGICPFVKIIANNRNEILQFSFCSSLEQLEDRLLKLAENADLRRFLGEAWRAAVQNYQPRNVESWIDFLSS
jgi:hypothetical protein